jgi:hypothetical protein
MPRASKQEARYEPHVQKLAKLLLDWADTWANLHNENPDIARSALLECVASGELRVYQEQNGSLSIGLTKEEYRKQKETS